MKKYPYNEDGVAVAIAGLQREDLERLIHGGMQFTADIVGLVRDNYHDDTDIGFVIASYLEESGML